MIYYIHSYNFGEKPRIQSLNDSCINLQYSLILTLCVPVLGTHLEGFLQISTQELKWILATTNQIPTLKYKSLPETVYRRRLILLLSLSILSFASVTSCVSSLIRFSCLLSSGAISVANDLRPFKTSLSSSASASVTPWDCCRVLSCGPIGWFWSNVVVSKLVVELDPFRWFWLIWVALDNNSVIVNKIMQISWKVQSGPKVVGPPLSF